jgi:hypothetical protein
VKVRYLGNQERLIAALVGKGNEAQQFVFLFEQGS